MVYLSAIGFALSLFPVHLYNYIYVNSEEKYAGLNIGVYGLINFFNANTVKNKPGEMQINKKFDLKKVKFSAYKIFNSLCIFKIVQLGDYGIKKPSNAYIAFAQNTLTTAIYKFIQINGHYAKLRNYSVLNYEHEDIRYYCKLVTILNMFVVGKILFILLLEKLNASKN